MKDIVQILESCIHRAGRFLVSRMMQDGWFVSRIYDGRIDATEPPLLMQLQAISLLIALKDFDECFCTQAQNALNKLDCEFLEDHQINLSITDTTKLIDAKNFKSMVVYQDKSLSVWSALMLLIYEKQNMLSRIYPYANTLCHIVSPDGIRHDLLRHELSLDHAGLIAVALLRVYRRTGDEKYLNAAACAVDLLVGDKVRMNQYDAWALAGMYRIQPDDRYEWHARRILTAFKRTNLQTMTALIAAMYQQSLLAVYPNFEWWASNQKEAENMHIEVLRYQMSLQIDAKNKYKFNFDLLDGGFYKNPRMPEIRLDYVVQNALSMLQIVNRIKGIDPPVV